jgi:hypothetical protein
MAPTSVPKYTKLVLVYNNNNKFDYFCILDCICMVHYYIHSKNTTMENHIKLRHLQNVKISVVTKCGMAHVKVAHSGQTCTSSKNSD